MAIRTLSSRTSLATLRGEINYTIARMKFHPIAAEHVETFVPLRAECDEVNAMELLLALMKKDRSFGDDAARRALLRIFELLGDDPRVAQYRRRMASLLH